MTRAEALAKAVLLLETTGVQGGSRDARLLLRWASGLQPASFSASLSGQMFADEAERFACAIKRRAAREPVSHIIGHRNFWGRDLIVTAAVLDPRPETETLIEAALKGGPASRVLDLGVGSGCILLTLLAEWPDATGLGLDSSADALIVAAENARRLHLAARAQLQLGDWLAGVEGQFDLIVSNPPYLSDDDMRRLQPELHAEPRQALHGGADGLDHYRQIAPGLKRRLTTRGRVLLEVGAGQAGAVAELLQAAGIGELTVMSDMDGRGRVVSGRRD